MESIKILREAYNKKQLEQMLQESGKIEAYILVGIDEMINTCMDGFLDMLDDYITNGYDLNVTDYKPVGVENGKVIIHVVGDKLNFDFERYCAEGDVE